MDKSLALRLKKDKAPKDFEWFQALALFQMIKEKKRVKEGEEGLKWDPFLHQIRSLNGTKLNESLDPDFRRSSKS
jgi:hypothetical protein